MKQKHSDNLANHDLTWKKILSDDVEAFQTLFNALYKDLVSYSHRFTQQQIISEEIVQEIFISLWERRRKIEIKSSLKSYLYRAVKNRTINYIKNQLPKDQVTSDINDDVVLFEQPEEATEQIELSTAINHAISQLPEKCRIIFLLSRSNGLSHKEIAEELDLSTKTVENQIGIALKKLKISLKPYLNSIYLLAVFEIVLNFSWGIE